MSQRSVSIISIKLAGQNRSLLEVEPCYEGSSTTRDKNLFIVPSSQSNLTHIPIIISFPAFTVDEDDEALVKELVLSLKLKLKT